MKLTEVQVKSTKPKGKDYKLADGEGLHLLIRKSGTKSWQWKYRFHGKEKLLTLGNYPQLSVKEARRLKYEAQLLHSDGIDPAEKKQQDKKQQKREYDSRFGKVAEAWLENKRPSWTERYSKKTHQLLSNWVYPEINNTPVAQLSSRDILDLLRKMENAGIGETTRKVKGLLEHIFAFAMVEGHINTNPVIGVEKALKSLPRVNHQRHLPAGRMNELLQKIKNDTGNPIVRLGFQLLIYTNVRTMDVRRMEWKDVDLEKKIWSIPAAKMKMQRPHTVLLNKQAISVLKDLKQLTGQTPYVLKSPNQIDKPVCENVFLNVLKRIGMDKATTTHGLRGTASTFLNEQGFRADVIEANLAHVDKNQIRKAYNHAEYLEERRELMNFWGDFVESGQTP